MYSVVVKGGQATHEFCFLFPTLPCGGCLTEEREKRKRTVILPVVRLAETAGQVSVVCGVCVGCVCVLLKAYVALQNKLASGLGRGYCWVFIPTAQTKGLYKDNQQEAYSTSVDVSKPLALLSLSKCAKGHQLPCLLIVVEEGKVLYLPHPPHGPCPTRQDGRNDNSKTQQQVLSVLCSFLSFFLLFFAALPDACCCCCVSQLSLLFYKKIY